MIAIPVGIIIAKRHIQGKLEEAKRAPLKAYHVSEDISVPELLHIVYKVREAKIISDKKYKEISHMITKEGATPETRELVRQILYGRDDQSSSEGLLGGEPLSVGGKGDWAILAALIPLAIAVSLATADRPQPVEVKPPAREQHTPSPPRKDEGYEYAAIAMAREFVVERLPSPSTAKVAPLSETLTYRPEPTVWNVQSYVDHQIRTGAIIRTRYFAQVRYLGNDKWELVELEER
ncbi:MAG: hypothetical protein EOM15_13555 [Spirochaetia bacterium]|nr:hypothetical protein [Spirochaetia bacterium]